MGMVAIPATGNEAGFEGIVRKHQAMVFSVALHFLGRRDLAEEVAQEVFIQLYQRLGTIQSPDHMKYWLRKVTAHRCIDYARREAGSRWLSLEEMPEPVAAAPVSDPLLTGRLERVLASLPVKARMVVVLRYQEEMELNEIAEMMEMPLNSVKSSLQRALALLRAKLSRSMEGVRP